MNRSLSARTARSTARSTAAALLLAAGLPAAAQSWKEPTSGSWSTPDAWAGGMVPTNGASVTLPDYGQAYSVVMDTNPVVSGIGVLGTDTLFVIPNGRDIDIGAGGLTNGGTISVNQGGGGSLSSINMLPGSGAINGSGRIVLGSETTALLQLGDTVTIAAGQTVEGTGRVTALTLGASSMNGVYDGNSGAGPLTLSGRHDLSGGGLARSSGSGRLLFVVADVTGGTITGAEFQQSNVGGGALLTGTNTVIAQNQLGITAGGIINSGTLIINQTGGFPGPSVSALESVSIAGTGEIVLNAAGTPAAAQLICPAAGDVLSIGAGQTVRGAGIVGFGTVGTVAMAGAYLAETPGVDLELRGLHDLSGGTSGGTAEGTGTPGVPGSGGLVFLRGATLTGGSFLGGVEIGTSTVSNLALSGINGVRGNNAATLAGGTLVNTGELIINTEGLDSNTSLTVAAPSAITGTGAIVLNGRADGTRASLAVAPTGSLAIGPGQFVEGAGMVRESFSGGITMDGVYDANVPGAVLELQGAHDLSGGGVGMGTSGGILRLSFSSAITGGELAGAVEVGNGVNPIGATLDGTELTGANRVRANGTIDLAAGGIINNGSLTLGDAGAGGPALVTTSTTAEIAGLGTIVLDAGANTFFARLRAIGGGVLTIGPGQRVTGTGTIEGGTGGSVLIEGGLAPGVDAAAAGEIRLSGPVALTPDASVELEFFGDADFDRLTGQATLTLAGGLDLALENGFVPADGAAFRIVDALSIAGGFAGVRSPVVAGRGFRIAQASGHTDAVWTCLVDVNGDGMVTGSDFFAWVAAFGGGGPGCDQNGDGLCDSADFFAFVAAYGAGCP